MQKSSSTITIRIDKKLKESFRAKVDYQRRDMTKVIIALIEAYVENYINLDETTDE